MNDLQREKFEEFWKEKVLDAGWILSKTESYFVWKRAWQAAIESVVVEFTEEAYFCPSKTELEQASDKGFSHAMEMVKDALDKAGIKYE